MTIQFASESMATADLDKLTKDVQQGDLTLIYTHYENEIRSPIKNIVTGDLLRLMLIQIQKSKV